VSDQDSSSGTGVVIERWLSTYIVPADHPAPLDLKARLDKLVAEELAAECERRLASLMDSADPSIWLIRELNVDLVLDANHSAQSRLADRWAKQLAVEINQIIAREEEGDSVLRFPNWPAYVAQFVKDLSSGSAWQKWYYRGFDSLRSLDASSAICEALLREPGQAPEVLAQLETAGNLESVLSAISEIGALRIYRGCFSQQQVQSAASVRLWSNGLLELWSGIALGGVNAGSVSSHDRLRLYAFTKVWFGELQGDAGLQEAIDRLLELRRILCAQSSYDRGLKFIRAAAQGEWEQANRILDPSGLETARETLDFLNQVSTGEEWNQRLIATLAPANPDRRRAGDSTPEEQSFLTACGGIFLLGPSFVELKIEDAICAAIKKCDKPEEAGRLLRHWVAVKCIGGPRAGDAIQDAGVKLFAGSQHAPSLEEFFRQADEADHQALLEAFARSLAQERRISTECLRIDLVRLPASSDKAMVIQDALRDEWIHIAAVTHGDEAAVERGLQVSHQAMGESPQTLLLGRGLDGMTELLKQRAERVFVLTTSSDSAQAGLAAEIGIRPGRLPGAGFSMEAELEYFSIAGLPDRGAARACELSGSLIARAVLKNFARKLIGFELSSPKYLFDNFLAGTSSVHRMPGRVEVQLPSTPLSVVLRLSGAYTQDYELPWLKEKEICLRAPSD
jgi:hypothetical protein